MMGTYPRGTAKEGMEISASGDCVVNSSGRTCNKLAERSFFQELILQTDPIMKHNWMPALAQSLKNHERTKQMTHKGGVLPFLLVAPPALTLKGSIGRAQREG